MRAASRLPGPPGRLSSERMAIDPRLEEYRAQLVGYCYRMLGTPFEAEDAPIRRAAAGG